MKEQAKKNKEFYLNYHQTMEEAEYYTMELLEQFIESEKLINHILYFKKMFPDYHVVIDEVLAEGDSVFVRAHFVGTHTGEVDGIPPTLKKVNTPFALRYVIRNNKFVDFWAIASEAEMLEQMGLARKEWEEAF